ncbi:cysteine desulfurase, partial [bacterium]|nr:cysteine desulfurase [bacterium]
KQLTANPSSRHGAGRAARQAIDQACEEIARALGAEVDEITFTSGATEGNNVAILQPLPEGKRHVLVLATEHPSSLEAARALLHSRATVDELPVDEEGRIKDFSSLVKDETSLAIVQLANSETGTLQEIARVRDALPEGCRLHVDAVQGVGRVPVHFHDLGATTLTFSGHKIHGPPGIGALLIRKEIKLAPRIFGGQQQEGLRPGSEPVALIVGLGRAVSLACRAVEEESLRVARIRDKFEEKLRSSIPDVFINGSLDHRLPNTCNVSFLGARAEAVLMGLDLAGVRASAGTACASGSLEPSPVLIAMGLDRARYDTAIRFSFSRMTTVEEVERATSIIASTVDRVRRSIVRE